MAPSNESTDRPEPHEDATNPFINFRRFADQQMSSLMHNVFGLASSTSSERRIQDYQTWLREARESRDRLNRETEEADRIMDLYSRAHKEGKDPAHEELHKAIQSDVDSVRCPYRPFEEEMPSERPHPNQRFSPYHVLDQMAENPASTPPQPLGIPSLYLLSSPYSPVKLVQQQALRDHSIDWREAFEDLLAAQKGQDMPSEASSKSRESSTEWVKGIMGMLTDDGRETKQQSDEAPIAPTGSLAESFMEMPCSKLMSWHPQEVADLFTAFRRGAVSAQNCEPEQEELTELDVYDRFLGRERPSAAQATARSFAQLQHNSNPEDTDGKKPSVLSTLTTTERTTLQDGTMHTKTVLKKRFSDGREVETETVHTQNALPQSITQQTERGNDDNSERLEKASKGWFWS